jgi:hypothetical protein
VFHSLRSIKTTLAICEDLTRYCPDAFVVNLTNPMSRVTLAISRATGLRHVGMCHEFDGGMQRLSRLLRIPKSRIRAKASGINHFTFFTEIRYADTGEDLYPRVRELWNRRFFDYPPSVLRVASVAAKVPWVDMLVDQFVTPLVTHMVRTYGVLPCSIDSHIGEYVPDAQRLAHWHQTPVDLHEGVCHPGGAHRHPLRRRALAPAAAPYGSLHRGVHAHHRGVVDGRADAGELGERGQPWRRAEPARRRHRGGARHRGR